MLETAERGAATTKNAPPHNRYLEAYRWMLQTRVLEIEFRSGAVYRYYGVPMAVYHDLLTARSPAHYLHYHIKAAGYPYRRVDADAEAGSAVRA